MKEMAMNTAIEKRIYLVKGSSRRFEEIWSPFLSFVEGGGVNGMSDEMSGD